MKKKIFFFIMFVFLALSGEISANEMAKKQATKSASGCDCSDSIDKAFRDIEIAMIDEFARPVSKALEELSERAENSNRELINRTEFIEKKEYEDDLNKYLTTMEIQNTTKKDLSKQLLMSKGDERGEAMEVNKFKEMLKIIRVLSSIEASISTNGSE